MDISALAAAMCIPSAPKGFCFWLPERRVAEQGKKDEAENR